MKKFLLLSLAALTAMSASAYDFKKGNFYYDILTDSTVSLSKCPDIFAGDAVIPSSVDYNGKEYKVTEIEKIAFYGCSALCSVTIPNSVTSIGSAAFGGCSALCSVTIPNSVTAIKEAAFCRCESLSAVDMGNSVKTIGPSAFEHCISLKSITLPDSLETIESHSFFYCTGLQSVTIPNSVTTIKENAFAFCTELQSVTIPNSVTTIDDFAFTHCTNLRQASIPNTIKSLGCEVFFSCNSLTAPLYNDSLFVTLPLTTQGGYSIPEGIKTICYGALSADFLSNAEYQITSITIPSSVTTICEYAFMGCMSLKSVYVGWKTPVEAPENILNVTDSITLFVPKGTSDLYKKTAPWNKFTKIEEYAPKGK